MVPGQENLTGTVGVPVSVEAQVANIGQGATGVPFWTTFKTYQEGNSNNTQYAEFESGVPNGFNAGASEVDGPQVPIQFTFSTPGNL